MVGPPNWHARPRPGRKQVHLEARLVALFPNPRPLQRKALGRGFAETPGLDNEHGQVRGVSSETQAGLLPEGPLGAELVGGGGRPGKQLDFIWLEE